MWKCPVCDTHNQQLRCVKCGFDGSCDYEQLPTLSQLPRQVESISRKRAALQAEAQNVLRCPKCGGTQFSLDPSLQCICLSCGNHFSTAQAAETPNAEISTNATDQPDTTQAPQKRTRGKIETWALRLGMVCIPLHAVSFYVTLHAPEIVLILIAMQLLMQYYLWKKGFACNAFLKRIWKFPDRFGLTHSTPPIKKTTASVFSSIPKIIFDSFAYVLTSLIIRWPAYIIMLLGYLAIFTPMADLGGGGLLYKLFDVWLKLLFLYTALWVHGQIRAMRK